MMLQGSDKKEKKRREKMKVMVAMDESERSMYALKWALSHLLNFDSEWMVCLLHVQLPFQTYIYPAGPVVYATPSVINSVTQAEAHASAALFARALKICEENGVKAETLTLRGDPKEIICQAIERRQIDLLVVGSRGLSTWKRAFLGSVSDYCAHYAKCPVLIVKPPKQSSS